MVACALLVLVGLWPSLAQADVAPPTAGLSWPAYFALGLAALAGVKTVLDGIILVLQNIAPRTQTQLDDKAEVFFERLDKWAGELTSTLQAVSDVSKASKVSFPAPNGDK